MAVGERIILVGLGANLPSPAGPPVRTLEAALAELVAGGLALVRVSSWFETEPVPPSDQPRFVNGAARFAGEGTPEDLLAMLLAVERRFGRVRGAANAARTLDLDLLGVDDLVRDDPAAPPLLPHPRLHERAFVLRPLLEVAPDWRHPVLARTVTELCRGLPDDSTVRPMISGGRP